MVDFSYQFTPGNMEEQEKLIELRKESESSWKQLAGNLEIGLPFIGSSDVRNTGFLLVVQAGNHAPPSERLERERLDELLRFKGQHNINLAPSLGQQARQVDRLVSGDRTTHTQHNIFRFTH